MFRQIFTSMFVPGGTHEQADWFNEIQRMTAPRNAPFVIGTLWAISTSSIYWNRFKCRHW
jgi:hypothetical protein